MHLGLKNKLQSELVRNSARLLSANIVAQAIGLLVYPILTRLYSPADFGLLNLFMSIGGILVLIATAEYQNAIVLPKEESRARAIVQLCTCLLLCFTLLLIATVPFSRPIASLFNAPDLARWWWLMPVYVLSLGGWQIFRYYLLRHKEFRNLSLYQYIQSILNAGGKWGFGLTGWFSGGMLFSSVFAPLFALVGSIGVAWKRLFCQQRMAKIEECEIEAKNYRNFPLYSLPRTLVNYLSGNLPNLMLVSVFGLTELGFFGMALTLAFQPINMIAQSIYQVLFQRTAQLVNEHKKIGKVLYGYVAQAAIVIIPAFVGLYFILPWLTSILLGDEWRVSGEYIRLMLPWVLMISITSPIGFVSDIFHKQKVAFGIEVLYLILRMAALTAGVLLEDFRMAIILYSLVGTVVIAGQLIWYGYIINHHDNLID